MDIVSLEWGPEGDLREFSSSSSWATGVYLCDIEILKWEPTSLVLVFFLRPLSLLCFGTLHCHDLLSENTA